MQFGFTLFLIQCTLGMVQKKDLRVFGYLLVVIPTQISGYGFGFLVAFIRRIIFNSDMFTGFEKTYYSN